MKLFGLEIWPTKSREVVEVEKEGMQSVWARSSWWSYLSESFAGAWQSGVTVNRDDVLSYFAVYSCISLIAQDISKMALRLVEKKGDVWEEAVSSAFTPVLSKPNHYQTRIKFIENWITSKLVNGNTYVLKHRDNRGVVVALYVLDPCRVTVLVSDSGDVFYQLSADRLAGLQENSATVPASEIIHDTAITLFHPLIGVSPIFACGVTATQGLKIQNNSTKLFTNMSRPSGILSAPGAISDDTAARLKAAWETNFSGDNIGKLAVVGDGLKYEAMTITPADAQLIEQLKMTSDVICSVFHVPAHMILGQAPAYNNIEALNQQYYSQALQSHIESIELLLDEGLKLTPKYGVQFDLDGLLRMDTAARYKANTDAIGGGWMAPNEARKKENLKPVAGGDTPYLQQQNFSLQALDKRDQSDDPFKVGKAESAARPPSAPVEEDPDAAADKALAYLRNKGTPRLKAA